MRAAEDSARQLVGECQFHSAVFVQLVRLHGRAAASTSSMMKNIQRQSPREKANQVILQRVSDVVLPAPRLSRAQGGQQLLQASTSASVHLGDRVLKGDLLEKDLAFSHSM